MTPKTFQWLMNNKLIVFFAITTFCLFVSTIALSIQKRNLEKKIQRQSFNLNNMSDFQTNNTQKEFRYANNTVVNYYRLPRNVKPIHYNLQLEPNIVNKTFTGSVNITIKIIEPTSSIMLHANNLIIKSVSLRDSNNKTIDVLSSKLWGSDSRELLQVILQNTAPVMDYELFITFTGKLDKGLVGFYSSTLRNGEFARYNDITVATFCRYSSSDPSMKPSGNKKHWGRLSPLVRPKHYKLILNPDMETGRFKGIVKITVVVNKQHTHTLSVHTKFLDIRDVKVFKENKKVHIIRYSEVKPLEQLLIEFESPLHLGSYLVWIEYSGDMTRNIVGLYRSQLKNGGTMVASKFQPTYARQAFPCFDEPDFKATYDISLVKPASYVALSNMNEVSKIVDNKTKMETVNFATSVPMSTYLVCFVICKFDYKETDIFARGIGRNFKLRSFAQRDQMHKIDFAQSIGKRVTEFYIKYYEVPFPLPKLDMIAIPDYVSGATEHWGLITYRETSFLVDNETASSKNKISVANTIAHELAHMWFGNLVTMKWWDEVWLNEGFASYMQVKSLNAIEPSWSMLDQFLTKTMHPVLVTDAKLSSHPILQNVETPDQITAIFDTISYNKGASILRMLESMLGEESFRRSISDYLKKYEYSNTVTRDLLLFCMDPYFKMDNPIYINISYIIETWTRQMGYPVVTVTKEEDNTYVLTQARFLLDSDAVYENDSEFNYRWFIPITYRTNRGSSIKILWFPDVYENVKITLDRGEYLIKINNNQVGFYRVNYPDEMWETLKELLKTKSEKLTISDRAHLLNDVFALAEARLTSYGVALSLTSYLEVERDFVPWDTAATIFNALSDKLLNSPAHGDLQAYVQRLIKPLYLEQTWEKSNLSVIAGLLRTRILSMAVAFELPEAKEKVRSLFLRWLNARNTADEFKIEPDLRDFVYYHGMKEATEADWENLWEIYLAEEDAQELSKLRVALSAPRNTEILTRYLQLAWDEKNIRSQDYLTVLHFISSNPSGTELVWADVRSRWLQLVDRFTLNSRYLGGLIPGISSSFNTETKLEEMEAWFKQYPEAGAGATARNRALETIRTNIKWTAVNQPSVADWLKEQIKE